MKKEKSDKLEKKSWRVETVPEFLCISRKEILEKVNRGLKALAEGRVLSQQEAEKRVEDWLRPFLTGR